MICEQCGAEIKSQLKKVAEGILANGMELYSIGGEDSFQVYGCSVGIAARRVFYLIKKSNFFDEKMLVLPVWYPANEEMLPSCVADAVGEFDLKYREVSKGDDLGLSK